MSGARSLSPRTAMVHGSEVITIERFIMEQERLHPEATGKLSNLLYDICLAAKIISRHVRRAGLADILGAAGAVNVSGDLQQKLDLFANETAGLADCLQAGKKQVAAGYILYGSSTMLVYTTGQGVHGFTLDPTIGEFLLSHPNIKTPPVGKYYSVNESNWNRWTPPVQRVVAAFKNGEGKIQPRNARYIGSLVADFHRNLISGGIFLYPADTKNPQGKLRLLYEAAPLPFGVEQAGGRATDGCRPILDIAPEGLHQKTPLVIGSKDDVAFAASILSAEAVVAAK